MKKVAVGIFALAVGSQCVGPIRLVAAEPATVPATPATPAAPPAEKPKEKENPLHLPPAKRAAAGILLAKPTTATLTPEVTGYGRVLDPVPLIGLVAEVEMTRAALGASEKELTRTQKLFEAGTNASAQSVEAATATVARDRVALASARARLVASVGRATADSAQLDQMLAGLEQGRALARVDVLAGDAVAAELKTVRVGLAGGGEMFDAAVLGAATTVDPQLQGPGFLVLLRDHPLPAGAALRATVPGAGDAQKAMLVPRSAVVYHQGSAWVFVLGEEDTFERKLVTVGRAVGENVAVAGVEESEQVVTTGAGQLLSAELQAGGAPEEG
ncbi:MAG: hypothetical protein ABIZ49_10080 [Opitutaceae bacterium]